MASLHTESIVQLVFLYHKLKLYLEGQNRYETDHKITGKKGNINIWLELASKKNPKKPPTIFHMIQDSQKKTKQFPPQIFNYINAKKKNKVRA